MYYHKNQLRAATDYSMVNTIIDAIEDAQGCWTEADWTHESGIDSHGNPTYCDGGNSASCGTCADAEYDAELAATMGSKAIVALQAGNVHRALDLIDEASSLEIHWGDDPCWGVPLSLLEEFATRRDKFSR